MTPTTTQLERGIKDLEDLISRVERELPNSRKKGFELIAFQSGGQSLWGTVSALAARVDQVIRRIFEEMDFPAFQRYIDAAHVYSVAYEHPGELSANVATRRPIVIALLRQAKLDLEERLTRLNEDSAERHNTAFRHLNLHPEIERQVGELYIDGYHSNAVEAAVKCLNDLVRMRSGLSLDGDPLMTTAFGIGKGEPLLRFNDLADRADQDEQKGFMYFFQGAVAGLRNPRAHKFIQDDPERALEFIAFVSLLAKLLDRAKKATTAPPKP